MNDLFVYMNDLCNFILFLLIFPFYCTIALIVVKISFVQIVTKIYLCGLSVVVIKYYQLSLIPFLLSIIFPFYCTIVVKINFVQIIVNW